MDQLTILVDASLVIEKESGDRGEADPPLKQPVSRAGINKQADRKGSKGYPG